MAAISFARRHEERLNMDNHRAKNMNKPAASKLPTPSIPSQNPDTRKLTQEELKERSLKNLCWHCDEHWSRDHRCKQRKFLMIKSIKEELEAKDTDPSFEDKDTEENAEPVTSTVHALTDYVEPQPMEVEGFLKHQPETILIDTGSTNNFMDKKVAAPTVLRNMTSLK
ncbi:hypothetical protein B296_00039121 [Ensete ventricosum]|uniref:Retrotransposon gag domain-containing protein n=1 Tax=Ensete ventricosum TaxID=4639 RepID=A0A426Y690_ENSVE|nr:hypothetical protein B296_00039121 [Ensete ventricosum]